MEGGNKLFYFSSFLGTNSVDEQGNTVSFADTHTHTHTCGRAHALRRRCLIVKSPVQIQIRHLSREEHT